MSFISQNFDLKQESFKTKKYHELEIKLTLLRFTLLPFQGNSNEKFITDECEFSQVVTMKFS